MAIIPDLPDAWRIDSTVHIDGREQAIVYQGDRFVCMTDPDLARWMIDAVNYRRVIEALKSRGS